MKKLILLAVAGLVAACGAPKQVAKVDPYAVTRDDSCYTVDLFTKVEIARPEASVPKNWQAFSGRWGGGKWAGEWCHDLYVLDIAADGQVHLVETYAPYEPWGKRATAFRRVAQIGEDGRLRLNYGRVKLVYWVENGVMYGARDEGLGAQPIAMVRRDA